MKRDLLAEKPKLDNLFSNAQVSDTESMEELVNTFTHILDRVQGQYKKTTHTYTASCKKCACVYSNNRPNRKARTEDKLWFTNECRRLYSEYKKSLANFNSNRCETNRIHSINTRKQVI